MDLTPEALRNNKMMNFSQKSENKHLFNPWSNMYKEGGGGGGACILHICEIICVGGGFKKRFYFKCL